jgi:rod shape-determining protein MreC
MPEFLKRLGAPIALVCLVLLATLSMVEDSREQHELGAELPWWQGWVLDVTAPIQRVVSAPVLGMRNLWGSYIDLVDVRQENATLRQEVAELAEINLQYREALVASGHLQRIAAMRDDFEVPMLPAKVVGLDISLWFRSVLVDRGVGHGVRAGNPLITNDGVVGLVTASSSRSSRAMLLLDSQSAIDGIVQRSRARGVVRGNGTGELEFEFVVRGNDVMPGDVIITSGLDSVYPKGLRIGKVNELRDPKGSLIQTAIIQPAVDFGRLEQVFVMFHRGPTMELLYGGGPQATPAVSAEGGPAAAAAGSGEGSESAGVSSGLEPGEPNS